MVAPSLVLGKEASAIQTVHVEKPLVTKGDGELQARFELLADRWARETSYHSSIKHIIGHPAYQEIIKMGPAVVPLILEKLSRGELDHWFYALSKLTGEYPIPDEARGSMIRMTQAWLDWGIANGVVKPVAADALDLDQAVVATNEHSNEHSDAPL